MDLFLAFGGGVAFGLAIGLLSPPFILAWYVRKSDRENRC